MNIVFDLGGVIFDWNPDKIARTVYPDRETQQLVKREVLEHHDWSELDRGAISFEQIASRGAARTGLPIESIEAVLNEVPRSLTPVPGTIDLIRAIVDTDNRLYVLSNIHAMTFAHLEKTYDIWGMFDGVVVSSDINMVKPETRIFEYLLDEHALVAAETVFIDDMRINLEAASAMGIKTIQFETAAQCRESLVDIGCIA